MSTETVLVFLLFVAGWVAGMLVGHIIACLIVKWWIKREDRKEEERSRSHLAEIEARIQKIRHSTYKDTP